MRFFVLLITFLFFSITAFAAIDDAERTYGATDINAATGNGKLTAAFNKNGKMTVLRWPSPSFYEHLNLKTSKDGRYNAEGKYEPQPDLGAAANSGIFIAIGLMLKDSNKVLLVPKNDADTSEQKWENSDGSVLITTHTYAKHDLTITEHVTISPDDDVLAWKVTLNAGSSTDIDLAKVFLFENLGPDIDPENAHNAALDDDRNNDYGVLFDNRNSLILHFIPQARTNTAMADLVKDNPDQKAVNDFLDTLDTTYSAGGIFFAISTKSPLSDVHCGHDAEVTNTSRAAITDAFAWMKDGGEAKKAADGQVNAAMGTAFLNLSTEQNIEFFISAADTATKAISNLSKAKTNGYDRIKSDSDKFWNDWLATVTLPNTDDEELTAYFKRALMYLKIAQTNDTATRASIVRSLSEQPPFARVFMTDVAMTNKALMNAGLVENALKQINFIFNTQNVASSDDGDLTGSWDSANFTNSKNANLDPNIRWEIDKTGFAMWSLFDYSNYLEADPQKEHIEKIYNGIKSAATFLGECKSERDSRLPCASYEGITNTETSTMRGALAQYIGLSTANYIGSTVEKDPTSVLSWQTQAAELREAMLQIWWYDEAGIFDEYFLTQAMSLWPVSVFEADDERATKQADTLINYARHHLENATTGASDLSFVLFAALQAYKNNTDKLEELKDLAKDLILKTATKGTLSSGKAFAKISDDTSTEAVFEPLVAIPHLPTTSLNLLIGYTLFGPAMKETSVIPEKPAADGDVDATQPTVDGDGGGLEIDTSNTTPTYYDKEVCETSCRCHSVNTPEATIGSVALLLFVVFWMFNRRRREKRR